MEETTNQPESVRDLFEDDFINAYIHTLFNLSEDNIIKSFKENRIQLVRDIDEKRRQIQGLDIIIHIPDFGQKKMTLNDFYEKIFEYEFHTLLIKQFDLITQRNKLNKQFVETVLNEYFDKTIKTIKYENEQGLILKKFNFTNGQVTYLVILDILNKLNKIFTANKKPSREPKDAEKRNSFFVKQYSYVSDILKKLKGEKSFHKLEKDEKILFLINCFNLDYFDDVDLIEFIIDRDKIIINENSMIKIMGDKVAIIKNPNDIIIKNINDIDINPKMFIINETPSRQAKLYICNKYNLSISEEAIKKKLYRGQQKILTEQNIMFDIDQQIKFLQETINTNYKYTTAIYIRQIINNISELFKKLI